MPQISIKEILEIVKRNWSNWYGLLFAIVLSIYLEEILLMKSLPSSWSWLIKPSTALLVLALWLKARTLQKANKNKIGFVVCIGCSDDALKVKVREDFTLALRRLLSQGESRNRFQFIEVPQHIAINVVDLPEAQKVRNKCRAHFILYGTVKPRQVDGEKSYIVTLDGEVAHKRIPENISKLFSNEFRELLPEFTDIKEKHEFFGFKVTAEVADSSCKYIIAIAALLSEDLNYSETLLNDVLTRVKSTSVESEIYEKLEHRIPYRLSEIYIVKIRVLYAQWRKTKEAEILNQISELLEKLDDKYSARNKHIVYGFKAIFHFIRNKDAHGAIQELVNIDSSKRDAVWHYNMAFLRGYSGDLNRAFKEYRKAQKKKVLPEKVAEIEEFIMDVLNDEPDKVELYYCLGFYNWKTKGDKIQAVADFKKFVELCEKPSLKLEIQRANSWIELLSSEIDQDSKEQT